MLRVRDKTGKQTAAYGFYASTTPPHIEAPVLRANTLTVPIVSSAGLDGRTLRLTVGGRTFDSQSPCLRWDGSAGNLDLDAAGAGLEWKDGEKLNLEVGGVKDNLGRDLPAKTEALTVDYSKQLIAPNAPEVLLDAEKPVDPATPASMARLSNTGTFEESIDQWAPEGFAPPGRRRVRGARLLDGRHRPLVGAPDLPGDRDAVWRLGAPHRLRRGQVSGYRLRLQAVTASAH